MSRLVDVRRPEPRGIGRQHLVSDDDIPFFVKAELEFRVGDDDALFKGVGGAFFVYREREVAELLRVVLSVSGEALFKIVDRLLKGDVLVVIAEIGLRGGGVEGLGELLRLDETGGQLNPADGSVLKIALPARAGDVTADDTLDGQHLQFFHHHAAPGKPLLPEELGHVGGIGRDHVILNDVRGIVEPELRHLRQHDALLIDGVLKYHVEAADPVGGDEDEVVSDVIDLPYLAFFYRIILFHGFFRPPPRPARRARAYLSKTYYIVYHNRGRFSRRS